MAQTALGGGGSRVGESGPKASEARSPRGGVVGPQAASLSVPYSGLDFALGQALLDEGVVTLEDIRQSIPSAMGNASFLKLLLCCPVVSRQELAAILVSRYRIPVLNLDAMDVPRPVLDLLPPRSAYELECLPLACVGDIVCVGVTDIRDRDRLVRIRHALGGRRIKVFPCNPHQLRRHIVRAYVFPGSSVPVPTAVTSAGPLDQPGEASAMDSGREGASAGPSAVAASPGTHTPCPPRSGTPAPCHPSLSGTQDKENSAPADEGALDQPVTEDEDCEIVPYTEEDDLLPSTGSSCVATAAPPFTDEEFGVLLDSAAHVRRGTVGSERLRAERVSDEDWEIAWGQQSRAAVKALERVHFCHGPMKPEPVTLGFPSPETHTP